MFIPLLGGLDIAGKTITADALLTQRKLAQHLIERGAHYVFIVKDNQPALAAASSNRLPVVITPDPPLPVSAIDKL